MGEQVRCEWQVRSCSSESDVHPASNVLKSELYRTWQTAELADEAWVVLEARFPSAFAELEIVNAGSALVQVFGLTDNHIDEEDDDNYIMLLSAQQLMSTKDVINKTNRNRSFTYFCSEKLSQLAIQHRWKRIKVVCRQPFGSEEQKTCIGLSRLNFKHCKTSAEVAADAAEARLQQNLKAGVAKLFPKSAECEVISQVTEPSRPMHACKVEKKVAANEVSHGVESPSPLRGKRKLPSWQSPIKQMKDGGRGKGRDASHGVVSIEEEEEIEKASQKRTSTPKVERPERKEPAALSKNSPSKQQEELTRRPTSQATKSPEAQANSRVGSNQHAKGSSQSIKGSEGCIGESPSRTKADLVSQSGKTGPLKKQEEELTRRSTSQVTKGPEAQANSRLGSNQHAKGSSQSRKGSEGCIGESPSRTKADLVSQPGETSTSPKIVDQPESSRKWKEPSNSAGKKVAAQSKSSTDEGSKRSMQSSPKLQEPNRANIITLSFSKFLDGVIFAISGLVNPERAEIRDKALEMGGQYRSDWSADCTLLICAFANTPKFSQVQKDNGTIVSKVWIQKCHQQKKLVDIEKYLMHAGKPWRQIGVSVMAEPDEGSSSPNGPDHDESTTTLASLQEVEKWVQKDVALSITWLKRQEVQPEAEELHSVAVQGVRMCLDDAVECLRKKQSIKQILESWDFVPRAVQELARREEKAGKARKKNIWSDMLSEAERLKWIYSKELENVTSREEDRVQRRAKDCEDDDTDDATTDVMPGDASSEDTELLDEDDIREAKEIISKMVSSFP